MTFKRKPDAHLNELQRRADDVRIAAVNAALAINALINRIRKVQYAGDAETLNRLPTIADLLPCRNEAQWLAEDLRRRPVKANQPHIVQSDAELEGEADADDEK